MQIRVQSSWVFVIGLGAIFLGLPLVLCVLAYSTGTLGNMLTMWPAFLLCAIVVLVAAWWTFRTTIQLFPTSIRIGRAFAPNVSIPLTNVLTVEYLSSEPLESSSAAKIAAFTTRAGGARLGWSRRAATLRDEYGLGFKLDTKRPGLWLSVQVKDRNRPYRVKVMNLKQDQLGILHRTLVQLLGSRVAMSSKHG